MTARVPVAALVAHLAYFQTRVVQDAVAAASASYWQRRADAFEAARHRPGTDYTGRASLDDLRVRWVALTELATACRAAADVALIRDGDDLS